MRRLVTYAAASAAAIAGLPWGATASAATIAFLAFGSAEQVYVLNFPANDSGELLNAKGRVVPAPDIAGQTVRTQKADSLGGLVFRNVAPGTGYRVLDATTGQESGPVTVHSDQAAPWDPDIYGQTIKDSGYQYLTTRDGTELAIDVHPPTSPAGEYEALPNGTLLRIAEIPH